MNKKIDLQRNLANQKQRFSIRKLSIGAASVLLGTTFLFGAGSVVHADTVSEPANQQKETVQENQSSDATSNQDSVSTSAAVKQQTKNASDQKDDQSKVESLHLSNTDKSINTQSNEDKPAEETNILNVQKAKQTSATANEVKDLKAKTEDQQEVTAHLTLFDETTDPDLEDPIYVELHAHAGETLREAINRQAKEDLTKQEKYFGPTGDDYVIDNATNKKVGVSPIVACQASDANISAHNYPAEVDQAYKQWKDYKRAHFPLAGYIIADDSSAPELDESVKDGWVFSDDDDGDKQILLTFEYTKSGYKNIWEKLKRTVKFKKYYSKSDLASDAAKDAAADIIDPNTNSVAVTHVGRAVLDTTEKQYPSMTVKDKVNAIQTPIDNINSSTSTMLEHPITDDANNEVSYKYFAMRNYAPAIGNISTGSTGNSGSNSVDIQFPAVKVSRDISEKDGNWTTFDNDIPISSNTDRGKNKGKGKDTYWFDNNGNFKLADKDIPNPAPRYVFYYHDQPVDVTFEDVSGGKEVKLSIYNASKLLDIRENSKTDPDKAKYTKHEIKQHKNINPNFKQYSYQADDNTYQNVSLNSPNKYAAKAVTALKSATNFKEVLAAYKDAGYEIVSEDADDLTYDKDKVWDRKKHLITQHRVVKLVITAKKIDAKTKTVNRTVNFKSSDGAVLRDPVTETVTYTQPAYYVDSFGDCVTADPKTLEITGTASKPKIELTSKTAKFDKVDEPEIKNGKLSGDWIRIDATKDSKQGPTLDGQVVPAEKVDSSVADKTTEAYTIIYAQKAVQKKTQKQATRTIHYVKDENKGLSVDKMPELQKTTEQKVALDGTYYTDVDGHYVSTKKVKAANGKEVIVVDKQSDTPIYTGWKLNADNSTKDVTGKGESYDFAAVNDPASIGTWKHQAAEDKDNGKVTVDPNNKNWQDKLADAYLVYKDPVAYNVHYIDVTGSKKTNNFVPNDGKEISDKEISNINGTVGEIPDKTKNLWNYAKDGYILVQNNNGNKLAHTELTENMGDAKDTTGDQYVYLMKSAIQHTETKNAKRTIHYVENNIKGKELQKSTVQNVTLTTTYYTDKDGNVVHAKQIKGVDGKLHYVIDPSDKTPANKTWTIDKTKNNDGVILKDNKVIFAAVTTPNTIGEWSHFTQFDQNNDQYAINPESKNWQETLPDGYLVYKQVATKNIENKQVKRTIHYVADNTNQDILEDSTVQTVNYTTIYYTDKDGKIVNAVQLKDKTGKTITDADGNEIYVVDPANDASTEKVWKVDPSKNNNGVTISDNKVSYNQVKQDEFDNNAKVPGVWTIERAAKNSFSGQSISSNDAPREAIDNNIADKSNEDIYLIYTKDINADITYWDISNGKNKKKKIGKTEKDLDNHGKTGQTITLPKDKTADLEKKGYKLVSTDYKSGDKYGKQDSHFNVYLIHDVESKEETTTQPRTIKYFDAETGEEVAKEVTQNVAWKRIKVTDKVTGKVLGYNTSGKKDQYGHLTIDTTDPDQAWVVTSTDKKYASVVSPDLTSKGYKKTPSLDQKKDNEDAAAVAAKTAIPTEKGGEVDVYYFHDTREKDVKKSETRTSHYVSEDGKTLQSPTVQTVTLNGKQTIDKVTGKQIGNTIWTVKTPSDKDGITVNKDGKASFKQVQKDVINKDNNTWTIQKANDQYSEPDKYNKVAPNDKVSSDFKDGHNSDIYLVYSVDRNADITYWDITNGKDKKEQIGKTEKDLDNHGKTGQTITLPKDKTADLEKKGYKLVSTDYKPGDKYGKQDSHFNVYLEHDTETVTDSKTVKETIHYIYKDSGKPAAKDKTAKVTFTRTGKKDKVTGKITWNNWTPDQSFSQVKSPEITNYKPDQTEVGKKKVSHNSKDIEVTVTYTQTSTTPQLTKTVEHRHVKRTINYVDTSNNQVDGSPNHTNSFDQDVDFTMNKYMLGGQLFGYGFGNFGVSLFAVYGGNGNFLGLSSTKGSKTPDKKAPDESWNDYAWSKAKPKSFSQVESGNKTKLGYQSVDKTQVGMQEVKATDKDSQALVVYDKSNKHKLVIHYQDENGHQLIPNKNNGDNYKTGDSFNSSSNSKLMPPKITKDGKTYILVPHRSYNPKGNFGNGDEFTIFVYREKGKPATKEHKLTINYVDENGNSISSSENGGENFKKGDSYTEASQSHMKKEITTKDGKTFILVPNKTANDHGEFGDGDEVTTYVYKLVSQKTPNTKPSDNNKPTKPSDNDKPTKPNEDIPTYPDHPNDNHKLIIHYVDENGKELAKPVVDPGYSTGDNFNSDSRRPTEIVKGNETYILVPEKTKNSHGTFGNHDESTIYVYAKKMINPDIASSKDPAKQTYHVTIQYVDQNGNKIAPDVHDPHEYHQGDHYDSNKYAKNEIHKDGKTYKMTGSKNTSGTISDHDETTTYYYETVRPIALGSKKDRKKSAQQKRAAKNTTSKDSVNQTISRKASVRKTVSRNNSYRNSTATLSEDQINNKKYNYATAALAEEDNAEAKQVESVNTHAHKSAKALPQTGEEKSNASILGLALASIAGFFGLACTSRKKRN